MDFEEKLLDQKLNEANKNAEENIEITTAFFQDSSKQDLNNKLSLPLSPTSSPRSTRSPIANMPSSRSPSPKKSYQATVEDCTSDSDSTLTEPEPTTRTTASRPLKSSPPSVPDPEPVPLSDSDTSPVLKASNQINYSSVRRPAKVRFSRQDVVVVHPPDDGREKQNSSRPVRREERQNSSRPRSREHKTKSDGLSAVDMKWGQLFDDKWKPTDRLRSVYRGIANFLMSEYHREETVLRQDKLRMFFARFPGGPLPSGPAKVFDLDDAAIEKFFVNNDCQYHCVSAIEVGHAREPALTSRGFAELMLVFAQMNPEHEATRLYEVMKELPIEARLHPDGPEERLPKQISRHLFPPRANEALQRKVLDRITPPLSPEVVQERASSFVAVARPELPSTTSSVSALPTPGVSSITISLETNLGAQIRQLESLCPFFIFFITNMFPSSLPLPTTPSSPRQSPQPLPTPSHPHPLTPTASLRRRLYISKIKWYMGRLKFSHTASQERRQEGKG